jgi:hypothetical protein
VAQERAVIRAESGVYSVILLPVLASCTRRRCLPTAREMMAKRSADGENAERVARSEESRDGGWESGVFETGLPFGGLTFCFFEEGAVAIRVEYNIRYRHNGAAELSSCHVPTQSRVVPL